MEKRDKQGKALHIRGLRQRWMVNSMAPVCVLLILVVILVAAGVSEYYYGSMRRGLEQRAQPVHLQPSVKGQQLSQVVHRAPPFLPIGGSPASPRPTAPPKIPDRQSRHWASTRS